MHNNAVGYASNTAKLGHAAGVNLSNATISPEMTPALDLHISDLQIAVDRARYADEMLTQFLARTGGEELAALPDDPKPLPHGSGKIGQVAQLMQSLSYFQNAMLERVRKLNQIA